MTDMASALDQVENELNDYIVLVAQNLCDAVGNPSVQIPVSTGTARTQLPASVFPRMQPLTSS